jgi:SH3-like domain-containing protein
MKISLFTLFFAVGLSLQAETNGVRKITVTGDRVSLRAKPDINSELLERAMTGEELVYLGETNGWIAVEAPEGLDAWVSGQYVENGTVQPEKLNVRSGPNKNYSVICVVSAGDELTLRGEFNEWLRIAPPPGCRVWISEDYAEKIEPPSPEPVPEPAPMPQPVAAAPAAEPVPAPVAQPPPLSKEEMEPLVLVLDKSRKQGEYDEIPGVLRRANPGLYKLVLIVGEMEEPICLVRGREEQMERYLNRAMLIKGKIYWAEGIDIPVIQPVKIHLDPILTD